jgi:D-threo-aldose 1-dehydrogenase
MNEIATRPLGRTGLRVTELGFGTAPLGGFRGRVPEREGTATLEEAWAEGIRYFDTAPFYGYGRAELLTGQLLRDFPRDDYVVSTKVGRVLRPLRDASAPPEHRHGGLDFTADFDYSYEGVMRSVEQSMLRTGLTRFDVLLVHDLDTFIHRERAALEHHYAIALDGAFRALAALRQQGIVRAIGVGVNEPTTCARLLRDADLDCVLLAGRFTLLDQTACDEVMPLCRQRGVAMIAGGPFNSGILATTPREGAAYHYGAVPREVLERARSLDAAAQRHGVTLPAAALQFALRSSLVAAVIPGARSLSEQRAIRDAYDAAIPSAFWQEIVDQGLVRPDAFTEFEALEQ